MFSISPTYFLVYYYSDADNTNIRCEKIKCCMFDIYLLFYIPMFITACMFNVQYKNNYSHDTRFDLLVPIIIINGLNIIRCSLNMYNFFGMFGVKNSHLAVSGPVQTMFKKKYISRFITVLNVVTVMISICYFIITLMKFFKIYDSMPIYTLAIVQLVWIYLKYVWLITSGLMWCKHKYMPTPKQSVERLSVRRNNATVMPVHYDTITKDATIEMSLK
jgi:hypothetical protein